MGDDTFAFLCAVAKEIDGVLIQMGSKGIGRDDLRTRQLNRSQGAIVETAINFHSPRINHRTQKGVFFQLVTEQDRDGKQG